MTLFRISRIPIRLDPSFVLLGAVLLGNELIQRGLAGAIGAISLTIVVFGSVLLHELGHALAARAFGIPTRSITLYPFGGVAALQVDAERPREELRIALAGPAVNLVLGVLGLFAWRAGLPGAGQFTLINFGMGIFNLLPAYPMDGGRVLRAWLSERIGLVPATLQALRVGRSFAWAFIFLGIVGPGSLLLVGAFLLFATWAERRRLAGMPQPPPHVAGWTEPPARVLGSPLWRHPAR